MATLCALCGGLCGSACGIAAPVPLVSLHPAIPLCDMTPLERLFLCCVFDAELKGDAFSFCAAWGPREGFLIDAADLRPALAASLNVHSTLADFVRNALDASAPDADAVDFSPFPWRQTLRDILQRSTTLQRVAFIRIEPDAEQKPDAEHRNVFMREGANAADPSV